jgi:uncharacterized protein (TIGR03083 family)
MTGIPTFDRLVEQIEDSTAAMREAISRVDGQVRERPGRTLRDLMFHVGNVQRAGADTVPGWSMPRRIRMAELQNEGGLYAWAQRSTFLLTHALRSAGPEVRTSKHWAPWGPPMTVRHMARRQAQEAAMHAYDAQAGYGRPDPLPDDLAINGIDEFLRYRLAAQGAWPHRPARVELRATMGPVRREPPMFWVLDLGPAGIGVVPREAGPPTAAMSGRPGDLLLALYGRDPLLAVDLSGDHGVISELLDRTDTSCH